MTVAFVSCGQCEAKGPMIVEGLDDPREIEWVKRRAVQAWNKRDTRHRDYYEAADRAGKNDYANESE